jgi:signal transduction histidine kinase
MPKAPHRFGIHASIVFQLGADLITDVVQALIELVKNSYDADAEFARIVVSTEELNDFPGTQYPSANGYIVVEDNGIGMSEDTIEKGWLTISNSLKRAMKRSALTTRKGRTPLGDKGLGRLGVQRLGDNIEIFTKPRDEDVEYHVAWSWKDFEGEGTLEQVNVHFSAKPSHRRCGTRLVISQLKDKEYWTDKKSLDEFRVRLAELISPYKEIRDFHITATVNGQPIETAEITDHVRRLAQVRYSIDFDGSTIKIAGRASLAFIRPKDNKQAIAAFESLVEEDGGERFLDYLRTRKQAAALKLRRARAQDWFVEFGEEKAFRELVGLKLIDQSTGNGRPRVEKVPADPGPFHAEIDAFDLSRRTANEQTAFGTAALYRDFVKNLSGVRIYRDGFGIRVDRDWIGLAKQWTGAASYYALKPENTLGYVALTARENQCLVETTDREGFKVTPHYQNFLAIFEYFRKSAHDAQEFLRREWLNFEKAHHREVAEVVPTDSPEELSRRLTAGLSKADTLREPLAEAQSHLSAAEEAALAVFGNVETPVPSVGAAKKLRSFFAGLELQLDGAQAVLDQLSEYVDELGRLRDLSIVLRDELQILRDQLQEAYEVVSLGLTAEALSHEIHNVADQMALRPQDVSKYLTRARISDARIFAYVEYVQSSIAALRKQMAHLAPSLKYVREKREPIDVFDFLKELQKYYEPRWTDEPMRMEVKKRVGSDDLEVFMNRGKLTQVFDNLVLNSEYWLREEIRKEQLAEGVIAITVARPSVFVADNGPGIDPAIEVSLFEPFVTKKPRHRGRGLGLFIVAQLLETEGCSISLTSKRNAQNRLCQFKVDLSGAIRGNQ